MTLVFVVVFLAMLGVAWTQIGAVLRIEAARAKQMSRDQGSLHAVAKGLRLLETPIAADLPHLNGVSYSTTIGGGSQWYKVTFTYDSETEIWTVAAAAESSQTQPEMPPVYVYEP